MYYNQDQFNNDEISPEFQRVPRMQPIQGGGLSELPAKEALEAVHELKGTHFKRHDDNILQRDYIKSK